MQVSLGEGDPQQGSQLVSWGAPSRVSPLRWCLVTELSRTHVTPAVFTPCSCLWDVAHFTVSPSAHSCQVFAEAPMLSACCSALLFKALAPYAAFWGHSCDPHPPSISPVALSLPPNVLGRTPTHPPCGLNILFQCHTCWTLEIPPRHLGWSLPLCLVTLEPDMCLSGSDPFWAWNMCVCGSFRVSVLCRMSSGHFLSLMEL